MINRVIKIIIFDGSFKTTSFINRLVKGLQKNHQVYILGFNEKLYTPIQGVQYVALGSNQNKVRFIATTLRKLLKAKKLHLVWPTLKKLLYGNRQALQQQNLDLALTTITPDIIHLQWPSVLPWFEEVLLKQQIPVVLSQRGFHNNVRPFVDTQNLDYLQRWYPKIAGFHSVSKAMANNGDKIWNAPEKMNHIVYTGLPLGNIPFSQEYKLSNPLKLISVGRAHWIKGYNYALRCCSLLKQRNISFTYTIIGAAGDEELQYLVNDLGLKENVILAGRKSQSQVFDLMREASVLLMPSVEEGLPNVIVEATLVGLPVISTNCGGVPELITDSNEGWLVPTRNPEAMANAIEAFVALPVKEIEAVRAAAREKAAQQHNEEQMVRGMEGLYFEVLGVN